jgi:hypothetical protein
VGQAIPPAYAVVPYFGRVRLRLKTSLLIAILAFAGNFGVSRVAPPQAPSAIIHVLASATAEMVAELQEPKSHARSVLHIALRREARRAFPGLDSTLFQRPPPALSYFS